MVNNPNGKEVIMGKSCAKCAAAKKAPAKTAAKKCGGKKCGK